MRKIAVKKLREKFSDVLTDVAYKDARYTVTRNRREMAVIISIEDYAKIKQLQENKK